MPGPGTRVSVRPGEWKPGPDGDGHTYHDIVIVSVHQGVGGRCPRCRTAARCREWAEAFGQLVAHDAMLLEPTSRGLP